MSRPGSPTKNEARFEYGRVPYGDKQVRGVTVRCGYCSEGVYNLPVNQFAGCHGDDANQEANFITRKLENLGWKIGLSLNQHRCPKCFSAIKFSAARKNREKATMVENVANPKVVTLVETRAMTRDDRRIIFEKLNEAYVSDKVGYAPGWSDQKVATDLGVPRAWVKLIRDENFGDELANEETRNLLNEAKLVLQDVRLAAAQVEAAMDQFRKASGAADRLSKSVGEIEKTLGL